MIGKLQGLAIKTGLSDFSAQTINYHSLLFQWLSKMGRQSPRNCQAFAEVG
jgi:hypothetical protein